MPAQFAEALRDRYLLERELGRGGMATVFLVQDLKHDRLVALKVLRPELAATLGPDRFRREIHLAARLQHPHILTVHDSGEAAGQLWFTMPYVEGESLRDRLRRERQLAVEDAVRITREAAQALQYAHEHGVVHRDIKPENLLLTRDGNTLVADFGIARALVGDEHLTQTGMSVGTPAYMSPEQASGDKAVDARTDIYSLGCVLYEMLAGEPPFTGPTAQAVIARRFTESVPSLRRVRPSVPDAVEQAVNRALARVPADRFATAAQFAQALAIPSGTTPPASMPATVVTQATAGKSIAVLPFADMSPQKDQDYFCEGIAEEIINALTKIQALRVASRTSAFAFKGKSEDIGEIGKKLKVATVLEGSVRKAENRLRVTAQLVSAADGYHLWSERYDRQLEDVFAIQDEIAQNIVRALRVMLSEEEKRAIERAPTDNVKAYDYYLRGRQFFHQWRRKGVEFARRMFERAIEIDPNYALAWAGIADCCSFIYAYWDASTAHLEQADTASRKALELAPELAEVHTSRGLALAFAKRYDQAEKEFEMAIRLNPKLFEAHYFYARAQVQQGKLREAMQLFEEACRLRPEDYQAPCFLAMAYEGLGRNTDANDAYRRALQLIEQHLELNPEDSRALNLGALAAAHQGQRERGLEWARRALALDPEDSGMLYNTACFFALQGERDEALDCLEKAVQLGFGLRGWIENDADWVSLRGDPRLQALLETI